MPTPPRRDTDAAIWQWWCDRIRAGADWFARRFSPGGGVPPDPPIAGCPVPAHDVTLLFRHMAALHIDRNALAEDDPLLFRELQGRCTLCRSRGRCVRDLADEFADPAWQNWRDYCPNATALSMLSALQSYTCDPDEKSKQRT